MADQETILLKHLSEKNQPIVVVAVNTECRQGELLRLTWADIDWNAVILTIRETKTGDSRRTPMNSTVQGLLSNTQKSFNFAPPDRIFPLDAQRISGKLLIRLLKLLCWLGFGFTTSDIPLPHGCRVRTPTAVH